MQEEVLQLRLNQIKVDESIHCRHPRGEPPTHLFVQRYAEDLRTGADLPKIVVFYDRMKKQYWLADGFLRYEAHKQIGRACIEATVCPGTTLDALLHAAGANREHGLRRSNADMRHAVTLLLRYAETKDWSDARIAHHCGTSAFFVRMARKDLAVQGGFEDEDIGALDEEAEEMKAIRLKTNMPVEAMLGRLHKARELADRLSNKSAVQERLDHLEYLLQCLLD
jgi:hypothetical protein